MKLLYKIFILLITLWYSEIKAQQIMNLMELPWSATDKNNASSLGNYGNISTNLFTGTPNVEIPLYKIKAGHIEVPIKLQYNINNVKPNIHPGEVGLGWDISTGGSITRLQKGMPDEAKSSASGGNWGYMNGKYTFINDDYYDPSRWRYLWGKENALWFHTYEKILYPTIDREADEFYFSFLGHSGSFSIDQDGTWKVISDTDFKVAHELSFFSNMRYPLNKAGEFYTIKFFNLTAPDGTVFTFGGNNAVEYSYDYNPLYANSIEDRLGPLNKPVATQWKLIKIQTSEKKTIEYEYRPLDPTLNIDVVFNHNNHYAWTTLYWYVNTQLNFPTYVKNIKYNGQEILRFSYVNSIQKDYYEKTIPGAGTSGDPYLDGALDLKKVSNPLINSYNEIKWNQLSKIEMIKENTEYIFDYTQSKSERLKLLGLKKRSAIGNSQDEEYKFEYNRVKFPEYWSGHFDHLGFYNGRNYAFAFRQGFFGNMNSTGIQNAASEYGKSRTADTSGYYLPSEMLETMVYPTGGYSVFEYEPHVAFFYVDPGKQELKPMPPIANPGGLRIKKITDYSSNKKFAGAKRYYYVNGFTPSLREGTGGSGISSFIPVYYWSFLLSDISPMGDWVRDNEVKHFTSQGLHPMSVSVPGHYLGYSTVVESEEDNSRNIKGYTEYRFTNFGPDDWGETHYDEMPVARLNDKYHPYSSNPSRTPYSYYTPISSKSMERGKITAKKNFNFEGTLLHETTYKYKRSSEDFIRGMSLHSTPDMGAFMVSDAIFGFSGAYKKYRYKYLLAEEKEIVYDNVNNIPLETTTEYGYYDQFYTLLTTKTTTNSKGETLKSIYSYPIHLRPQMYFRKTADVLLGMYKINEVLMTREYNGDQLLSESYVLYNSPDDTIVHYLPQFYYTKKGGEGYSEKKITYNKYDDVGNLLQYTPEDGIPVSIIWGYNRQYPIAKIEGVEYSQIETTAQGIQTLSNSGDEGGLIQQFLLLRNYFPQAMITTYTYKPWVGITSITPPNGITEFYEYDSLGKLKQIKDKDGEILKSFEYHYKE